MSDSVSVCAVVLAAGKGTRMKSPLSKMLHPVAGQPLIRRVIGIVEAAGIRSIVVVLGHDYHQVAGELGEVRKVRQAEQRGTAHATELALRAVPKEARDVLVICGDTPLIRSQTIKRLLRVHRQKRPAASLLTAIVSDPGGYGRILRKREGIEIVEHKNASLAQRRVEEINAGTYVFDRKELEGALLTVEPDPVTKERFLTRVFDHFARKGLRVVPLRIPAEEVPGINTQAQLAAANDLIFARVRSYWLDRGVTMLSPETVFIEPEARLAPGVRLDPCVVIAGRSRLGKEVQVGAFSILRDAVVGARSVILPSSHLEACRVGERCRIGPSARLRPETVLGRGVRVGNFVEIKKSRLGDLCKVNHLSYIGDAVIGAETNVGAGTITCNYDGRAKHRTRIGARAFVGSDSILVAPLTIGDGAYVAAGSVVTQDIPPDALGIERSPQRNIPAWARRRR